VLAFVALAFLHIILNQLSAGRLAHNVTNLLGVTWFIVGIFGVEWVVEIKMLALRVWLVNLLVSSALIVYKQKIHNTVSTLHLSLFNNSLPLVAALVGVVVGASHNQLV
jgi:hypothetical protein